MDLLHLLAMCNHQGLGTGGQVGVKLRGGGLLVGGEVQRLGEERRVMLRHLGRIAGCFPVISSTGGKGGGAHQQDGAEKECESPLHVDFSFVRRREVRGAV